METKAYIEIASAALNVLKEKGKSSDVSSLLMEINVPEPGVIQDLLIEIALAAKENEEAGAGCYSVEDLEKALEEIRLTGSTNYLIV